MSMTFTKSFVLTSVFAVAALAASGARADDVSDAVSACRTAVAGQVEGLTTDAVQLDRIGGGGRVHKVWLKANGDGPAAGKYLCVVKRDGTVRNLTAFAADGSPAKVLLAAKQ